MSTAQPARAPISRPASIEVRYLDEAGKPRAMGYRAAGAKDEGDAGGRRGTEGRQGETLELRLRWFGVHHALLLILCIWWDAIFIRTGIPRLILDYGARVAVQGLDPGGPKLVFVLLALLAYSAMCAGVTYYTLAGLLNRTRVVVDGERLTVRHGPVPWSPRRVVDTRTIQRFRVERVTEYRPGSTYDLNAVLAGGSTVRLLRRTTRVHARFAEQVLSDHLGLAESPPSTAKAVSSASS
ncbi:hypothetical protein [Chondromyces apiculatus]|uniref:Uncharacterized protein n=1 Tax=Chondromyces apiculatus DSM 436 TaxID=1192034 RepID=A0A017TAR7_9BACT|nr:hypothetical protein [Chondromyces apiculatus]EYF06378.1 Hypothetical protein CAP_1908 [Chondromyces apiculatus DSM 436]